MCQVISFQESARGKICSDEFRRRSRLECWNFSYQLNSQLSVKISDHISAVDKFFKSQILATSSCSLSKARQLSAEHPNPLQSLHAKRKWKDHSFPEISAFVTLNNSMMTSYHFNAHSRMSVFQDGGRRCVFGSDVQRAVGSSSFQRLGQRKCYTTMRFEN